MDIKPVSFQLVSVLFGINFTDGKLFQVFRPLYYFAKSMMQRMIIENNDRNGRVRG